MDTENQSLVVDNGEGRYRRYHHRRVLGAGRSLLRSKHAIELKCANVARPHALRAALVEWWANFRVARINRVAAFQQRVSHRRAAVICHRIAQPSDERGTGTSTITVQIICSRIGIYKIVGKAPLVFKLRHRCFLVWFGCSNTSLQSIL